MFLLKLLDEAGRVGVHLVRGGPRAHQADRGRGRHHHLNAEQERRRAVLDGREVLTDVIDRLLHLEQVDRHELEHRHGRENLLLVREIVLPSDLEIAVPGAQPVLFRTRSGDGPGGIRRPCLEPCRRFRDGRGRGRTPARLGRHAALPLLLRLDLRLRERLLVAIDEHGGRPRKPPTTTAARSHGP